MYRAYRTRGDMFSRLLLYNVEMLDDLRAETSLLAYSPLHLKEEVQEVHLQE